MTAPAPTQPIWEPSQSRVTQARIEAFRVAAERASGLSLPDYWALHRWSVEAPEAFWTLAWTFCGLVGEQGARVIAQSASDPGLTGVTFFPDAQLNVVQTFLKNADDRPAILFRSENGARLDWSRARLLREVEMLASALRAAGVGPGDHVVGHVPNMPQTVAAMLATASLGAIWASSSPETGPDLVEDRFGQIEPKVLFACDGYPYGGRVFDTTDTVAEIARRLPSLRHVVIWPYAGTTPPPDGAVSYDDFLVKDAGPLAPQPMGFRDPQYVLFSSGTTGKPKCIEHAGGGTLLRLLVEQQLHADICAGDRLLYFTTCNWMMWNWMVAALASEAAIVLFDGNPVYPDISRLFDVISETGVTHFGTSAKFIEAAHKAALTPRTRFDLGALRAVLSTGSPLSPEGFAHVLRDWKDDVHLASICGGTDIMGGFIVGVPTLPVYAGQIQAPTLGLDVATLDEDGQPVQGVAAELVCRNAHPSMPVCFVGDVDNACYRASYFEHFPGIWRQGDFAVHTEEGGFVILGRSDATLNPGGIRIGTAEIYRPLDRINAVLEAVVVGQQVKDDLRVVLFVMLRDGCTLTPALIAQIKTAIRHDASPRHVPAVILAVTDIPRTTSGKIAELAVRDAVNGRAMRNLSGLANPQALAQFTNRPELQL